MSKLPNPFEAALVTVESAAEASGWACAVLTKPPESILLGFRKNSPFPYFAFDTHSQAGRVPACFFSIVNFEKGACILSFANLQTMQFYLSSRFAFQVMQKISQALAYYSFSVTLLGLKELSSKSLPAQSSSTLPVLLCNTLS